MFAVVAVLKGYPVCHPSGAISTVTGNLNSSLDSLSSEALAIISGQCVHRTPSVSIWAGPVVSFSRQRGSLWINPTNSKE